MSTLERGSPIEVLDRAFAVLRGGPLSRVLRAWLGAAPLGLCVVATYALERVEGITDLRAAMAVMLCAAFLHRCVVACRIAREVLIDLRPGLPMAEGAGRVVDVICSAGFVGLGLWLWLWPMALLARISPFALAALVPLFSLRGAVAPSWLARAGSTPQRGFAVFLRALDDNAGSRVRSSCVEACVLFGSIGVFANLYALAGLLLVLSSSLFGLDVAFVSAFLSPDNELVLLLLVATALIVVEPLRAAISAVTFSDARGERDGADLHAAIDALARPRDATGRARPEATTLLIACLLFGASGAVEAQAQVVGREDPASSPATGVHDQPELADVLSQDARVQAVLESVLARHEFYEPDETRTRSLWQWLLAFLDRLTQEEANDEGRRGQGARETWHVPPWIVMVVALAILALAVALSTRSARRMRAAVVAPVASSENAPALPDTRVMSLDEADALANAGKLRDAVRVLYVATLASLDRARVIRFEPDKTNGQYLRALPRGEVHRTFSLFTQIFDRTHYGGEPPSLMDYETARALAAVLCTRSDAS